MSNIDCECKDKPALLIWLDLFIVNINRVLAIKPLWFISVSLTLKKHYTVCCSYVNLNWRLFCISSSMSDWNEEIEFICVRLEYNLHHLDYHFLFCIRLILTFWWIYLAVLIFKYYKKWHDERRDRRII